MSSGKMRHEEKAKGIMEEVVTASQDVWFEFSSVTMNKTSSLTSSSTSHMVGCVIARMEAFGSGNLDCSKDRGEKRRGVV